MRKKEFFRLTPFKMQVLQSFPFIDADFDALTNYELLCKVVEYLNITVNNVNLLSDDFKTLYDYVHDYFDNLDVQEEINNKLDEMAESGELTEIIAQYLTLAGVLAFNTVSDMKLATNIVNGSYARTLGYYSINDGGDAIYKIRDITNEDVIDDASIISIGENNLIAELINKEIYVEQFGCYGDETHDDTTNLQKAIDYCIDNKLVLKSKGDKTFKITSSLNLNNRIDIDFNGSTIKAFGAIDMLVFNYSTGEEYQGYLKNIVLDMNNIATIGIHAIRVVKKTISEIVIKNISGIGYQIDLGHEVIFENSHLYGSDTLNTSIGLKLLKGDCHYKDLIMIDVHTAVWASSTNFYTRIHAWMKTQSLINGSIFMKCDTASTHFLNQCYSDTYQYPFYVTEGARIKLTEHYNFNNQNIMTSDVISAFTDPYVYMFYYSSAEYTRYTTINNSNLLGYSSNSSLTKFSNIALDNWLSFIDANTYEAGWNINYKNNYIPITATEMNGTDFDLVTNFANRFIVSGNVVTLTMKLRSNKFIASKTAVKLGTIPERWRPLTETVFFINSLPGSYEIKNPVMVYILSNGEVYVNVSGDTNTNDVIVINHTYVTTNNRP